MSTKIRFGIIGCGRISYKHVEALAELNKDAEIIAVCDIVQEKAEEKANEYVNYLEQKGIKIEKPKVYTDIDKILEEEKLDIVSICTPSGLHPEHGIKAARKGINVLSEKPMGTNLKSADEFIKVCDEEKVRLFVVMQNRLNATLQLLKAAIEKDRFGKIYMILANVLWTRPQSYYDAASWRGTWELDGGAFMNQASHYIDLLSWLGGEVEAVSSITGTLARNIQAEDTGSAVLKYKSGAIGNINVTMLTYPKNLEGSITVIGEKGTAKIAGVALNRIETWDFVEQNSDDKLVTESNYEPPNIYGLGHAIYYENVIDVLKNNAKPATDGRSARKSLELILSAYKASREGKTVNLPLDI